MNSRAIRTIVVGQSCLYVGLLITTLLKPQGLAANDGISYYGIYARTVGPMAVGLLGSAFFSWQAANQLRGQYFKLIKLSLITFALLTIVIVVTPYSVSSLMDWLHTAAGSALFSLQLLLSGWLVVKLRYNFWVVLLTLIELAAGIACAIYLKPAHGFLVQCQILFQLTFGVLLVYSLKRLEM